MRDLRALLTDRASTALLAFQLLFFGGMSLSKTVQPLYFDHHHALDRFGASYAAMALAGTSSFLAGLLHDRWSLRGSLTVGTLLYAFGLTLRVCHDSTLLAMLSGVTAGLGASIVLVSLRAWTFVITTEDGHPSLIAARRIAAQLGTSAGAGAAGLGLAIWGIPGGGHGSLLAAAGIVAIAAILTLTAPSRVQDSHAARASNGKSGPRKSLGIVLAMGLLGAVGGLYTSFVTPYLPLILEERGVKVGLIGLSVAFASLLASFSGPLLAARFAASRPLPALVIAEGIAAAATVILVPAWGVLVSVAAITARSVAFASAATSEEILQYRLFHASQLGLLFGASQTGFLAGDAIGGICSGWIYQDRGSSTALLLSGILIAVNCAAYPLFVTLIRTRYAAGATEVVSPNS